MPFCNVCLLGSFLLPEAPDNFLWWAAVVEPDNNATGPAVGPLLLLLFKLLLLLNWCWLAGGSDAVDTTKKNQNKYTNVFLYNVILIG